MDQLLWFGFILAAGGAVAGFAAGLLGIGGGAILVPVLYEVFGFAGVDEAVRTHLAVGTSLAVILPTGLRSAYGHNQKQGVDWSFVKLIAVFIVVGVVIGTLIANYRPRINQPQRRAIHHLCNQRPDHHTDYNKHRNQLHKRPVDTLFLIVPVR